MKKHFLSPISNFKQVLSLSNYCNFCRYLCKYRHFFQIFFAVRCLPHVKGIAFIVSVFPFFPYEKNCRDSSNDKLVLTLCTLYFCGGLSMRGKFQIKIDYGNLLMLFFKTVEPCLLNLLS